MEMPVTLRQKQLELMEAGPDPRRAQGRRSAGRWPKIANFHHFPLESGGSKRIFSAA
jgi:hypothetical protein